MIRFDDPYVCREDATVPRRRRSHVVLVLVVAAALAACVPGPGTRIHPAPGGFVTTTANTGWGTKQVVQKKAPETLMAEDGTICRVSPDRFEDTKVGALVPCNWQ